VNITRSGNIIEIEGIIKNMNDANKLNEVLEQFPEGSMVTIRIKDSFAMPSAVIGNLLKKVQEGIHIKIEVGNPILYEVLDDLNLVDKLNVTKI